MDFIDFKIIDVRLGFGKIGLCNSWRSLIFDDYFRF